MSPVLLQREDAASQRQIVQRPSDPDGLILEAWAQGFLVGALIIMSCITMANMRKGILLHKVILLELILGIWQGFWLFFHYPIYGWWLSVSAIFLNASWSLHNVIAWMKIKPFLSRPVSWIFIGTVILVQPYWVLEIYANFAYFHGINNLFEKTRPWEALCRDPWWIFTTVSLVYNIKTRYEITLREIVRISPRFCIMLGAMIISIIFVVLDILSVTTTLKSTLPVGINPFWKLSFVFKCLTDSVVLDDFKTALDRLRAYKISRLGSFSQDMNDSRNRNNGELALAWEELATESQRRAAMPSPDGDYVQRDRISTYKPHTVRKEHHKEHKDPVIDPKRENGASHGNLESPTMEDPLRQLESAFVVEKDHDRRSEFDDMKYLEAEDYGAALREVSTHSPPISPTQQKFPRRSRGP